MIHRTVGLRDPRPLPFSSNLPITRGRTSSRQL
jgi:hypothetical protein